MKQEYRKVTEFKTSAEFAEYVKQQGFHIALAPDGKHDALGQSIECMGMTIGNRWAILPMEGWDCLANGKPSGLTVRRWHRFASSGAKLIYGTEAAAVMESGRSNPRQLMINDDTLDSLKQLVTEMRSIHRTKFGRDDDLCIGIQLTHSGRYSHPHEDAKLESVTAYAHPLLDKKFGNSEANVVSDEEIGNIVKHFISAARVARDAGFDFVDIKHAHGYLAHEFLTAFDRPGKYGGSFENRTRFCREIIEGIKREVPEIKISVRLSFFDILPFVKGEDGIGCPMEWDQSKPYPYAFGGDGSGLEMDPDLKETSQFIDLLKQYGVDLICGTIGSPYYSVHMQRPAYYPVTDGYTMPEHPLYNVGRHLLAVKRIKELHPDIKFVASGLTCLQEFLPNVAEYAVENNWTDFAGIGRMVLSYPEMCADVQAGRPLRRQCICRTFGDCTNAPRNGMISGCFPLDEFYRQKPAAMRLLGEKKILNSNISKRKSDRYFDACLPPDLFEKIRKGEFNKRIYPEFADRKAWEKAAETPFAARVIEAADAILDDEVPALSFSKYRRYAIDGNRAEYETLYFTRRKNLAFLLQALCLTGNKEKYMPRLLDHAVAITEEWTWCLPAHMQWHKKQLMDYQPSDLFCNESGMVMAHLYHLLGAELDKEIEGFSEKLRQQILQRTVYNIMYDKRSEFMHFWLVAERPNNWTPWCGANALICAFLCEKDMGKLAEEAEFFLNLGARFAGNYEDDGFCDEGPDYFSKAALMLFDILNSFEKAVPHSMDKIFAMPRIKNMFEFIAHVRMGKKHQLCFADSHPRFSPSWHKIIACAAASDSELLKSLAKDQTVTFGSCGDFISAGLTMMFDHPAGVSAPESEDAPFSFYEDRIAILRSKEFSASLKAGHNEEAHNHNDLGHFTLYSNGEPLIVDAGSARYAKINFSDLRYTLWYVRGAGHNAPVFGDFEQLCGKEYQAKYISANENELICDLSNAYPAEAGVEAFVRTMKFAPAEMSIEDRFVLAKPLDAVVTLLTPGEVEISDGKVRIGDVILETEGISFFEQQEYSDIEYWETPLKALRFKSTGSNYRFVFRKAAL